MLGGGEGVLADSQETKLAKDTCYKCIHQDIKDRQIDKKNLPISLVVMT